LANSHKPDAKGFDVTGVVTKVDLKFPHVKDECDYIQECLNRPSTYATYVYKFSTLYSQFNPLSAVTVSIISIAYTT